MRLKNKFHCSCLQVWGDLGCFSPLQPIIRYLELENLPWHDSPKEKPKRVNKSKTFISRTPFLLNLGSLTNSNNQQCSKEYYGGAGEFYCSVGRALFVSRAGFFNSTGSLSSLQWTCLETCKVTWPCVNHHTSSEALLTWHLYTPPPPPDTTCPSCALMTFPSIWVTGEGDGSFAFQMRISSPPSAGCQKAPYKRCILTVGLIMHPGWTWAQVEPTAPPPPHSHCSGPESFHGRTPAPGTKATPMAHCGREEGTGDLHCTETK